MRAVSALLIIAAIALSAGCVSPGKPYAYLDVRFSANPVAAPVQPAVNQATTVAFSIRNTFNEALTGVTWNAAQTVNSGTAVSFAPASGTVDIPAFGSIEQSFSFTPTSAGSFTFTITLDQAGSIAESDEGNNTASVTVVVADLDISFGSQIPPSMDAVPAAPGDLTLRFTITNTNSASLAVPESADVTYRVYLDDVADPPVTAAVTPNSATIGGVAIGNPLTVPGNTTSGQIVLKMPHPPVGNHTYMIVLSSSVTELSTTNNTVVLAVPVAN